MTGVFFTLQDIKLLILGANKIIYFGGKAWKRI